MNTLIDSEYIIETIRDFLRWNNGDEATEALLINLGCQILDISQDKFLEMI